MSLHIEASYSLNIQAMMFQQGDIVKLHSLARIRECFAKDSLRPHAMGNKQKRIIQHSRKLVKPEPKQYVTKSLKSKALRSAKSDLW